MTETPSGATTAEPAASNGTGPDLRREFVGIMFALAVGEVGMQTAGLVQAGHFTHYLPAYSHLFLALFVIAASWVGWSRTQVPAAKKDVKELFEWPFVVLLLDTAMVVTYFILVRTVDFSDGNHRIDSAKDVALWHIVIFGLYVVWDFVTKVAMYQPSEGVGWLRGLLTGKDARPRLLRIAPTVTCFIASWWLWSSFSGADAEHILSADFALLSMVLLFRALKSLVSAVWQTEKEKEEKRPRQLALRVGWSVVLLAGLVYGSWLTAYSRALPLPGWVIDEIRTPVAEYEPTLAAPLQAPVPATSPVVAPTLAPPPEPAAVQAPETSGPATKGDPILKP